MTDNENTPTLRDQFAMAALGGLSAKVSRGEIADDNYRYLMTESIAEAAYDIADAMLKEREK